MITTKNPTAHSAHSGDDIASVSPIDISGVVLAPGNPGLCSGNGETLDENGLLIECCCDECDFFLLCLECES